MDGNPPRVGIFVCECGGNIGDVVDVKTVIEAVKTWEGVVVAKYNKYLCSRPAQDIIINAIAKKNLDRVVVASCTPRMHLPTFQSVLERAGLNPYMLEFVNIREQASWVHGPKASAEATKKALTLIRGGYERSLELEPLESISEKSSREILIIGGGIAGITAALELGYLGHKVHVIEKRSSVGGNMAKLTKVFPTLDCAQCILTPRMAEIGRNPNVNLLTYAEVQDVSGRPGNYTVKIFMKPRGVDTEKCRSCGVCAKVCPVTAIDEYNEGLSERKAAYIEFPQAVPSTYTIDFDACTKCGKCEQMCPAKAINLEDKGKIVTRNVGAIIMATGYQLYDANMLQNYGYGIYRDVITMMDLERLTSASGPTEGFIRRADGSDVGKMAIILCAGSRDKNYIPYCSRICCMYSLKQAFVLKKMLGIDVCIYYTDIRATGKGYEELYWRDEEAGVVFIRGKVAEIWKKNDKLVVLVEDTLMGEVREDEFDLIALATPMVPPSELKELAGKMKLSLGEDGFIQEKHPKLDPVDSLVTGVFACGCAISPKDVRDTVSDALGAAAKASLFLKGEYITTSPEKAFVIEDLCNGSGLCVPVCPVNAIVMKKGKAKINPFICIGCGACIPVCPKEAIDFKNSTNRQIISNLRGVLMDKEPSEIRIVAFVDKSVGYTGMDFLGLDRVNYPESIRIIAVPSTAIIGLKHLLSAFAFGADGVLVIEGQEDIDEHYTKKRMIEMRRSLEDAGVKSMRVRYSYVPLPVYKKAAELFTMFAERIKKFGPLTIEKRKAIRETLSI
ncbi:hydrogenase iron-sulfur subunit [Candidatus Bathyarchaeota archaeon]|nr:hydrogenase iron-sulfur subunit [Candidatus Bathyarchaeota archaeon]NIV43646.1 hydrogenase iron-sulfur subunit [Candidatus Bathyarchaeota archaeon]